MIFASTVMKMARTHSFAFLCASLLIAGCAGSDDKYPSLAVRDVERAQGQFSPVASETAAPIRPVASAQDLDSLIERALNAHRRFSQAEISAAVIVGMGRDADIGSNRRQEAQLALANLIAIRSDTAVALADLDLLAAKAETTFAPIEEINIARSKVETLIAGQDGTIAGLSEVLDQ